MAADSLRRAHLAMAQAPDSAVAQAEFDATGGLLDILAREFGRRRRASNGAAVELRAAGLDAEADAAVLFLAMQAIVDHRPDDATALCQSVLAQARRRGDHLTSAGALLRLSVCRSILGDERDAAHYYARALGHLRDLGFATVLGQVAEILGSCLVPDTIERAVNVTELLGAMSGVREGDDRRRGRTDLHHRRARGAHAPGAGSRPTSARRC